MPYVEDWEKPRTKGDHLTDAEINIIRQGLITGRTLKSVAMELKCTVRTITAQRAKIEGRETYIDRRSQVAANPKRGNARRNIYQSDFEPT